MPAGVFRHVEIGAETQNAETGRWRVAHSAAIRQRRTSADTIIDVSDGHRAAETRITHQAELVQANRVAERNVF
jgi:hypothetical protein